MCLAMGTPHPAICWTSFYKSRKTPTLPPLAQWVQGQDPDRVQGRDQVPAVVHQQAELQVAEQVRTSTIKPYKLINIYIQYYVMMKNHNL